MAYFKDRKDAGEQLARKLSTYAGRDDVIVLALPRGGVPVGYEIACSLGIPLEIFIVRKIGAPGNEELAMGAIASGGIRILNESVVRGLNISQMLINEITGREEKELQRREQEYRGGRLFPDIRGKTVLLVDDGLATGSSMKAAIEAVRQKSPRHIVVAVPVAPYETCESLKDYDIDVICLHTPFPFFGVGGFYNDFSQTSDDEVKSLLEKSPNAL